MRYTYTLISITLLCLSGMNYASNEKHTPLGLPEMVDPTGYSANPDVVKLGHQLFFDTNFSRDGTIACSSCHVPEKAYVDNLKVAKGHSGLLGGRKSPTALNAGYNTAFFWDGRRETLEQQVTDPFFNPKEHGLTDFQELLQLVKADESYRPSLAAAFGVRLEDVKEQHVTDALAAFVRTLVAGDSPVDRYLYGGDKTALTESEIRGLELFRGQAECSSCHTIGKDYALFTDNDYHNMSIGFDDLMPKLAPLIEEVMKATPAERETMIVMHPDAGKLGRFMVTLDPQDIGKFKTPSLRNIALMAPYMHDGSIATLEDTIERELYYRGEQLGRPIILTPDEKEDLVAFMKALNSPVLP